MKPALPEKLAPVRVSTPATITFRWPEIGRTVVTAAGRHTGFWVRVLAGAIDFIILWVLAFLALLIPVVGGIVILLLAPVYFTYFEGVRGATLGKQLVGIQVVNTDGKGPIGVKRAFLRFLARLLSFAVAGVGVAWIAIDAEKQAWHDKMLNTLVVYRKDRA